MSELPFACVFLCRDGRVIMDGSRCVDIQITGIEKAGETFRTLGHIGGAMLFVPLTERPTVASSRCLAVDPDGGESNA